MKDANHAVFFLATPVKGEKTLELITEIYICTDTGKDKTTCRSSIKSQLPIQRTKAKTY